MENKNGKEGETRPPQVRKSKIKMGIQPVRPMTTMSRTDLQCLCQTTQVSGDNPQHHQVEMAVGKELMRNTKKERNKKPNKKAPLKTQNQQPKPHQVTGAS